MFIAVATDNGMVAQHFGRCEEYTIFETKSGCINDEKVISNPGHEPGFLPNYLTDLNVGLVIAGGMGRRAVNLFAEKNIKTCTGVAGPVRNAVESYLSGTLEPGISRCEHDRSGYNCS